MNNYYGPEEFFEIDIETIEGIDVSLSMPDGSPPPNPTLKSIWSNPMFVKPAPGRVVHNSVKGTFLPGSGQQVPDDIFGDAA